MKRALTWSYGGGVQSIAIAVLVAQGKLPVPECIVIADTGREATETWEYLTAHVQPLLATVGAKVEIASHALSTVDLYALNGDILMPVFTENGALPTLCSNEWKKRVFQRYVRGKGYGQQNPIETWIGFSKDEIGRCSESGVDWQKYTWPLLDFEGRIDGPKRRYQCRDLILQAGLPEPPKSSCWDCPFRKPSQWRRLRDHYPQDFAAACRVDRELRAYDIQRGHSGVYLLPTRIPLEEADLSDPDTAQLSLEGPTAECSSGMCWT